MNIKVRRDYGGKYSDVTIEHDNIRIELGLLNAEERLSLAEELKNGLESLLTQDELNLLMGISDEND